MHKSKGQKGGEFSGKLIYDLSMYNFTFAPEH